MSITQRPPCVFVRGQGSYLWDQAGKRYLDFVQGWAVNCLGHSPKLVSDAIAKQAQTLITPSPAYFNDVSAFLAQRLVELSGLHQVFFTNSGGEANEGAIKLARKFGALHRQGAYEIITFHNAFHGRTLATMSASGKKAFEPLFEPKVPGFPKATVNDLGSVEALIGPKTIAVMIEPIQGEAGVIPATDDFLRSLRGLTRDHGLLLIFDEIQTGIGRTGKMFQYEHMGIAPDILSLGKGLGGGVPIAAVLANEQASCFEYGDQGGTFNGNPLVCAAGLAVVNEVSKPSFLENVAGVGRYLAGKLDDLSTRYGLGGVRGRGLLLALDLARPIASDIAGAAFERGLLLNAPRPDALRFMPALTLTAGEVDEMIGDLDSLLRDRIGTP